MVRLCIRRVAYRNCLLSLPVDIVVFIFIFHALGRGYRTSEEGRRAEGKGRVRAEGHEHRHTVRRETV